ncbi:MAG: response regulator transcription factor [Solirubrobacteraceae bacterium]|jgi:two-component system response regulator NreC
MAGHLQLAPEAAHFDPGDHARSPIRVVLADDHDLVRSSVRRLLDGEEDVEVIAEAGDLAGAVRHVQDHRPCVLVLDLMLPDGSSLQAIGPLRERVPATRIVVMTMENSPAFAQSVLAAGAAGFVSKELADGELVQAVRAAALGERYVSPRVASRLGDALFARKQPAQEPAEP